MTDKEVVELANKIAREFYRLRGYCVIDGYRFDRATHPHEVNCWDMACYAIEELLGTDVENALEELGD